MSPMMEEMLVHEVVPRLRKSVHSIPKVGHEDDEEIVQDATLMAARMMDSAEQAGRKFTAGNMAYFATKAARSGRRSYYSGRSDVFSPGCQIDGKARHEWMRKSSSRPGIPEPYTTSSRPITTRDRNPTLPKKPHATSTGNRSSPATRLTTAPPSSCWWKVAPCVRPANAVASRTAPR